MFRALAARQALLPPLPSKSWLAHRTGLLALALATAFSFEAVIARPIGYDLAAYLSAAQRLLAGAPLYPALDQGPSLGPFGQFFYPPLVAVAFVPIALLPATVSFAGWFLFLAVVSAGVAWSVIRTLPYEVRPWAAAAFAFFFPLGWEVSLGNLTLLSLALCLLGWHLRERPRLAGAVLAAAVGLKLLPLALLAFFIAAGRTRILFWSLGFGLAAVILSWPWLGGAWLEYIALVLTIARGPATGSNVVPTAFAQPETKYLLPALAIVAALAAGRFARAVPALETYALYVALAAAPFLSATVFYPYLVFALPLLIGGAALVAPARRPLLRTSEWAGRVSAWMLMESQFVREPGRDFIFPFFGLLLLILIGLAAFLQRPSGD